MYRDISRMNRVMSSSVHRYISYVQRYILFCTELYISRMYRVMSYSVQRYISYAQSYVLLCKEIYLVRTEIYPYVLVCKEIYPRLYSDI